MIERPAGSPGRAFAHSEDQHMPRTPSARTRAAQGKADDQLNDDGLPEVENVTTDDTGDVTKTDDTTSTVNSIRRTITITDGVEVEDDDDENDDEFEPVDEDDEPERKPITPRVAEPRPPALPRDFRRDGSGMIQVRKTEHEGNLDRVVAFFDRDERHPTKNKEVWLTSGQTARVYPTPSVIRAIRDGRLEKPTDQS